MQRDGKRDFILSHEHFILEIRPDQRRIDGSAELIIQPLSGSLRTVRINSRQCRILETFVNDKRVEHQFTDAIANLKLEGETDISHHQTYKSRYLTAIREADEGELFITLPEDCVKPVRQFQPLHQ
ncbi:hypothetical protein BCR43DRAFT_217320 [Syncephalastrum racemosum]|uniref:Uncharacterized protein n=1 Tax=Syncephalastrum racemosum TaxID=13706 RepID=A0A1X2HJ50_SYNRA|nr:hypothetical protein BCR43DRAFT_217320 [Syncephalastrum racemosum]